MILKDRILVFNKWFIGWTSFLLLFALVACMLAVWEYSTLGRDSIKTSFMYLIALPLLLSGFHYGQIYDLKKKQHYFWFGYFFLRYRKKYPPEPWTDVMVGPIENRHIGRGLYLDVFPVKILIGNTYKEVSALGTEESALRLGLRIAKTALIPLKDSTGSTVVIRRFPEPQKSFSDMISDRIYGAISKPSPAFKPELKPEGLSIAIGIAKFYFYSRIAIPTVLTVIVGALLYWTWNYQFHLINKDAWGWALIVFYIGLFWSFIGLLVTWHRRLLGFHLLVSAKTGIHLFGKTIPPEDIQDLRVMGGAQGHSHLVIFTEKRWVTFAYGFSVDELTFLRGLILSGLTSKS